MLTLNLRNSIRLTLALMISATVGFVFAPSSTISARAVCVADVASAVAWLADFQNPDGGFTNGFAAESDFGTTADLVFALTAAGEDIDAYASSGKTALDYLTEQVKSDKADSAGKLGKLLLALSAATANPAGFSTRDLVAETTTLISGLTDGSDLYSLALAILGLSAVGAEIPESAVTTLVENQLADSGGWGFSVGDDADTNTTALAVQALIAAGAEFDTAAVLSYFKTTQNEDGGFPYQKPNQYGTDSDANSTAGVIQALLALGEPLEEWGSPDQALADFQQANGAFTFQLTAPADSILATVQAIPALCHTALFIRTGESETNLETPAEKR